MVYLCAKDLGEEKATMSRSVIALFYANKSETMTLRAIVLRRLLQVALVGMVAVFSFLTGTIISGMFFNGVE